jgi:hypothetical protein
MRKKIRHEHTSVYFAIRNNIKEGDKDKNLLIDITHRIKKGILGHACSMHGRVQKCIGLQNSIRKNDRKYNCKLEDNIKNKIIIRDKCGSELGLVLGFFTYGLLFLLSEDNSDAGVVVTDIRHHIWTLQRYTGVILRDPVA